MLPEPAEIVRLVTEHGRAEVQRLERAATTPEEVERIGEAMQVADEARIRRILAQVLARIGNPAALPALLGALDDADPEVVAAAEDAIGNSAYEQSLPDDLRERLETRLLGLFEAPDSPQPVRTGAQYALGLLQTRSAVPALIAALGDPEPIVRWNSAEALSHIGDPVAIDALEERLGREDHARVATLIRMALESLRA